MATFTTFRRKDMDELVKELNKLTGVNYYVVRNYGGYRLEATNAHILKLQEALDRNRFYYYLLGLVKAARLMRP